MGAAGLYDQICRDESKQGQNSKIDSKPRILQELSGRFKAQDAGQTERRCFQK
jgi:hypothetical protein